MTIIETIKAQAEQCEAEARKQGHEGGGYELTSQDCDAITFVTKRLFGRKPTREEWAAAGLPHVGSAHREG
jgi:hypothetical protein